MRLSRQRAFCREHLFGLMVGGGAFWEFILWAGFFAMHGRTHTSGVLVFEYVFNLTLLALYSIWLVRQDAPHHRVVLVLVFTILTLVINFSYLYWTHGTVRDFSQRLSHLDALYFTLGTLSTAGTGTISATSETSRGLVSLQMAVDVLLLVVAVGMAVSRLTTRSAEGVRHGDRGLSSEVNPVPETDTAGTDEAAVGSKTRAQ